MANEISVSANLRYSKNKAAASLSTSFLADQAGSLYQAGIQVVGTVEENLDIGDVATIGYVAVRNADATNYIELGATTGVYSLKLKAGEGAVMRWTGGTDIFVKANTASCDVEYLVIEN